MSGYTDDSLTRHGVLDAATPFIEKPFKMGELAAKIQDVLRGETAGE
jgi:DNA-binding response OmpR family regulator